jgi:hypothetical protein
MYYSPGSTVVYDSVTANLFNAHYNSLFSEPGHASNFNSILAYIKELYDWKNVTDVKYIDADELYVVTLQDKRAVSDAMRRMMIERKKFELIVIPEQSKYFNFDLLNGGEDIFSSFRLWVSKNIR